MHYIEQRLNEVKGKPHSLALAAYALHLAESSKKDEAFKLLEQKAITKSKIRKFAHYADKLYCVLLQMV